MSERVDIRRESKTREAIIFNLKSLKSVDEKQIQSIMQKWTHYEYKISGVNRSLVVFCEYIKYQETLLQFVRMKSAKPSIKDALERYLKSDIKKLMEICMDTPSYQGEFDLFMLKLSFFRMTNDFNAGSTTVNELIKAHPSNPKTWNEAGKWFVRMGKPEHGIYILQQGLDKLGDPVNTDVYYSLIALEIDTALGTCLQPQTKKKSEQHQNSITEQLVKKLDVYVSDFEDRDWIDSAFLFGILDRFYELNIEYSIIENLQRIIKDKFGHLYQTWELLILRDKKEADNDPNLSYRIMDRFQEGCVKLSLHSTECSSWWSLYLNYLLDINCQGIHLSRDKSEKHLMDAFKTAAECHMLEEKHYLNWLDLVPDEDFESIVDQSLNDFPNSVDLWNVKVNCALMRYGRDQRVFDVFDKATKACGKAGVDIWNSMLRFLIVNGDSDQVEAIYRKGINPEEQPTEIVNELKPNFIQWLSIRQGSDIAIQEYDNICEQKPYCKGLHDVVLKFPSFKSNKEMALKAHRLMCKQFSHDGDVYYRFVLYHQEFNFKESILKRKEAIQKIYDQARSNLDENDDFFKQFSAMKSNEMIYLPNASESLDQIL